MHKRLLVLFLAMILIAALVFPTNAAYENTYTNTGDQRADIIGVALTQVGYREGSNNYTKYGEWYGMPNAPWCGAFVSWCASQAGIPTSVLKKTAIAHPSNFGLSGYFTSDERVPRPGDLFFTKTFNHVGIVYYVDGGYVYTLEGNTNDSGYEGIGVFCRRRALGNLYYASPNYRSDASHNYVKGYDVLHPHKEYYQCSICRDKYYTGNTEYSGSCLICIVSNCDHSYGGWSKAGESSHKRTCSKCGNEQSIEHEWDEETVVKEANCSQSGTMNIGCSTCGAKKTVTIPANNSHDYGNWTFVDESTHSRICTICAGKDTASHDHGGAWQSNEKEHWQTCEACSQKQISLGVHQFGSSCENPCDTCGYKRPNGHLCEAVWTIDDTHHWYACVNCEDKVSFSEHSFDAECDETCNDCGYTRQTSHAYETEYTGDGTGHWHACRYCGQKKDLDVHTPGPEATELAAQTCLDCGYELVPALAHTHTYDQVEMDRGFHWGVCACGFVLEKEAHLWDMGTGACAVCGMQSVVTKESVNYDFVWVVLCAAAAVGILIPIIIAVNKKKAKKEFEGDPYWD